MKRFVGLSIVGLLAFAACSSEPRPFLAKRVETTPAPPAAPATGPTASPRNVQIAAVGLERFDSCAELLSDLKSEAIKITGPWGIPGYGPVGRLAVTDAPMAAPLARSAAGAESSSAAQGADSQAAAPAAEAQPGVEFSETNVQEAGVDEPDTVKTDGKRIFALSGSKIFAVRPGSTPQVLGTLDLSNSYGQELLLSGDRLLVFAHTAFEVQPQPSQTQPDGRMSMPYPASDGTTIHVVDVADPSKMRVVQSLSLEGGYVSARLSDGLARVVVTSRALRLPFTYPQNETPQAQAFAEQRNKDAVRQAGIGLWLPRYRTTDDRGRTDEGRLSGCERTYRPVTFSGLGSATVVTIDPKDPKPQQSTTVVADAQTVYASPRSLFIATGRWQNPTADMIAHEVTTEIHGFDISGRGAATYVASGVVPGHVLNQWSLSQHKDHLRVATTVERFAPTGFTSESIVTVLAVRGQSLVPVGTVGGLGRGERIYAVRFIGELGYVVTFRQVDPLYVLNLGDPEHPRLVGELKIPGYSAYLHPIGPGLLLGVGQNATDEGRVLGLQAAIFDVSDPAKPKQVHKYVLDAGRSQAEFDHHAFLWWAAKKLAVLPVQLYTQEQQFMGAVALRADVSSGIAEAGRITHASHVRQAPPPRGGDSREPKSVSPDSYPQYPIERSLVIGGQLYTLSQGGLMASDLESLTESGWVAFV